MLTRQHQLRSKSMDQVLVAQFHELENFVFEFEESQHSRLKVFEHSENSGAQ